MRRLAISIALAVASCRADPGPVLETEHLRFYGELEGVCEGLGVVYERELARLESELGRELIEPIDVFVGEAAIVDRCAARIESDGEVPSGCAPSGTELATLLPALSHELVHAIRIQHGVEGVPLVEEGLAVMLGTSRPITPHSVILEPRDPGFAPVPLLDHGWPEETDLDRDVGAHFLHWADGTYGRGLLLDFLWSDGVRRGDAVEAAAVDAFGATMLEVQARWSDEAEREAVFSDLCWGVSVDPLPAEGLRVEGSACCTDPAVEQDQPPLLRLGRRCFAVDVSTELEVELVSGEGNLVLRPDGCDGNVVSLEAGERRTFTAGACAWHVAVWGAEECGRARGFEYVVKPLG